MIMRRNAANDECSSRVDNESLLINFRCQFSCVAPNNKLHTKYLELMSNYLRAGKAKSSIFLLLN